MEELGVDAMHGDEDSSHTLLLEVPALGGGDHQHRLETSQTPAVDALVSEPRGRRMKCGDDRPGEEARQASCQGTITLAIEKVVQTATSPPHVARQHHLGEHGP